MGRCARRPTDCLRAYAEDSSEPVEAHLYDLFEYYDDLVGSSHYASNGILFMTYYFEQFEDAEQSQIGDTGVAERQRLLAELAADVDEYRQLADEIAANCDEVATDISGDWEERALSEVVTAGYQPPTNTASRSTSRRSPSKTSSRKWWRTTYSEAVGNRSPSEEVADKVQESMPFWNT